eukprot:6503532-Prymnesium_polylepis.1
MSLRREGRAAAGGFRRRVPDAASVGEDVRSRILHGHIAHGTTWNRGRSAVPVGGNGGSGPTPRVKQQGSGIWGWL